MKIYGSTSLSMLNLNCRHRQQQYVINSKRIVLALFIELPRNTIILTEIINSNSTNSSNVTYNQQHYFPC